MGGYSLDDFRRDVSPLAVRLKRRATLSGPTLKRIVAGYEFVQKIDTVIGRLSQDERANPALITHERVTALLVDTPISADDVQAFRQAFKLFESMSRGGS